MKRVYFFISNNNHHWENFKPVIEILIREGYQVQLISLCELRRMQTPDTSGMGIRTVQLFPHRLKRLKTSSGSEGLGGNQSVLRNVLRFFLWIFLLRRNLMRSLRCRPDLVIVPNDVAYPFNYICSFLKRNKIPFFLFQEGIRFALPNEKGWKAYGTNGAERVMVWGEQSGRYFQQLGCRVVITGSPRYDDLLSRDYSEEQKLFESKYVFGDFNVLFASNPIDDQGFCSKEVKLRLFERFLLLVSHQFPRGTRIFVRLHPREDKSSFYEIVIRTGMENMVSFVQEVSLFVLFRKVDLVVIFASTIGLEALINGARLAVLKIPGYGYAFDYVQSGVGTPVDVMSDEPFEIKNVPREVMNSYWRSYLHQDGQAALRIAENIAQWVSDHES